MPLWPILQSEIERKEKSQRPQGHLLSVALPVALHVALISVVKVNGVQRCARISSRIRTRFSQFHRHLDSAKTRLVADGADKHMQQAGHNIYVAEWWVKSVMDRSNGDAGYPNPNVTRKDPMIRTLALRQRDNALLLNPWVAGQQLLVVGLGCELGCGSTIIDNVSQTRAVFHLYNAMLRTGKIGTMPVLDVLLTRLHGRALWFYGRPKDNFLKAYFIPWEWTHHQRNKERSCRLNRRT
jgi:hypothetical protein